MVAVRSIVEPDEEAGIPSIDLRTSTGGEATSTKQTPPLLNLPPEICNTIRAYSLREDDNIIILQNKSTHPSDWVNACKQVRNEAHKMWFAENWFEAPIKDLDYIHCVRFMRYASTLKVDGAVRHRLCAMVRHSRNWSNPLAFCKVLHQAEDTHEPSGHDAEMIKSYKPITRSDASTAIVAKAAMTVTRGYRRCSWEECEKALKTVRELAGSSDARWLQD